MTQPLNAAYAATGEAVEVIPVATSLLEKVKSCFDKANEDFLSVEIKIMITRLNEIEKILIKGDFG